MESPLGNTPVQSPRTQLDARKAFDVLDEGVAVFWATSLKNSSDLEKLKRAVEYWR
jgi:hypothetical protein